MMAASNGHEDIVQIHSLQLDPDNAWDCFLSTDMHACCQIAARKLGQEGVKHEQTSRDKAIINETRFGLRPIVEQGCLVEC